MGRGTGGSGRGGGGGAFSAEEQSLLNEARTPEQRARVLAFIESNRAESGVAARLDTAGSATRQIASENARIARNVARAEAQARVVVEIVSIRRQLSRSIPQSRRTRLEARLRELGG